MLECYNNASTNEMVSFFLALGHCHFWMIACIIGAKEHLRVDGSKYLEDPQARAIGMTTVADKAGLGRESLHKALGDTGNPEFATVLKLLHAMGLRLSVVTATEE